MIRVILGAVAGFVVWSILWVGTDAVLPLISPDWYGRHLNEFGQAVAAQSVYTADSTFLVIALIRSIIFSIIAGYIAALVARENALSPILCGVLLLLFGIFIQSIYWNYVPLWYHISFLLLLIPMTFLGGKLRKERF
jgi:hypothetical protein